MRFTSDDQRKAMFARIKGGDNRGGSGGSKGGKPKPPPKHGKPSGGGSGSRGGGLVTPPNKVVFGVAVPTTANFIHAVMHSPILGIPGAASLSTWLTAHSSANMPQFNLLYTTTGWNPTPATFTQWLFEGTIFEKKKDGSGFMWFETSGVNHDNAVSANPKQR